MSSRTKSIRVTIRVADKTCEGDLNYLVCNKEYSLSQLMSLVPELSPIAGVIDLDKGKILALWASPGIPVAMKALVPPSELGTFLSKMIFNDMVAAIKKNGKVIGYLYYPHYVVCDSPSMCREITKYIPRIKVVTLKDLEERYKNQLSTLKLVSESPIYAVYLILSNPNVIYTIAKRLGIGISPDIARKETNVWGEIYASIAMVSTPAVVKLAQLSKAIENPREFARIVLIKTLKYILRYLRIKIPIEKVKEVAREASKLVEDICSKIVDSLSLTAPPYFAELRMALEYLKAKGYRVTGDIATFSYSDIVIAFRGRGVREIPRLVKMSETRIRNGIAYVRL